MRNAIRRIWVDRRRGERGQLEIAAGPETVRRTGDGDIADTIRTRLRLAQFAAPDDRLAMAVGLVGPSIRCRNDRGGGMVGYRVRASGPCARAGRTMSRINARRLSRCSSGTWSALVATNAMRSIEEPPSQRGRIESAAGQAGGDVGDRVFGILERGAAGVQRAERIDQHDLAVEARGNACRRSSSGFPSCKRRSARAAIRRSSFAPGDAGGLSAGKNHMNGASLRAPIVRNRPGWR